MTFFLPFLVLLNMLPGMKQDIDPNGFTCKPAMVIWRDACIYTKQYTKDIQPADADSLTALTATFGCVISTEKTVMVVFNFVEGKPSEFQVIPKDWAVKVVPLIDLGEKK